MGELVTFTGIAGGLQSLLTPEFTHGINAVYVFDYYMNHASIIAVGLYIIYVHQQPLQKGLGCATSGVFSSWPSLL